MPAVGKDTQSRVGEIGLARVDGVVRDWRVERDQPGDAGEAVVREKERRQLMFSGSPGAIEVELILLTLFRTGQKAIAGRCLESSPLPHCLILWAPGTGQVGVAPVRRSRKKRCESASQIVGDRQVQSVVPITSVKGCIVYRDGADGGRNHDIGIGVSVAVSVRRQVVLK